MSVVPGIENCHILRASDTSDLQSYLLILWQYFTQLGNVFITAACVCKTFNIW